MADTHAVRMKSNEVISNLTIDGTNYSEALKSSNLVNNRAKNCKLIGGSEDCLDVVRGYGTFVKMKFHPSNKTRQTVTAKGGCDITISESEFHGNAKKGDIIVGDFTIYDAVQKNRQKALVRIGATKAYNDDGTERPVKVVLIHGELDNTSRVKSNVKIKKYPSLLVKIYFFFARLFTSKKRKEEAKKHLQESPDVRV